MVGLGMRWEVRRLWEGPESGICALLVLILVHPLWSRPFVQICGWEIDLRGGNLTERINIYDLQRARDEKVIV